MRIQIIHKFSEKQRFIYEFDVYGSGFKHIGTYVSNRNGKNDIWGDLWHKHFSKDREQNINERLEYLENCGCSEEEIVYDEKLNKIRDKYNPVCLKTNDGRTRYYGIHGDMNPNETREEYRLKLSKEQIKKKILAQLKRSL